VFSRDRLSLDRDIIASAIACWPLLRLRRERLAETSNRGCVGGGVHPSTVLHFRQAANTSVKAARRPAMAMAERYSRRRLARRNAVAQILDRRVTFCSGSGYRAGHQPSGVAGLASQPGFDDRRQLTSARPTLGSSTWRWPWSRPLLASTSSGVRVGTSGKTGRPPGSRTSGARDRWKTS
jgi:hypothetical protein